MFHLVYFAHVVKIIDVSLKFIQVITAEAISHLSEAFEKKNEAMKMNFSCL